jgi:hypothetical protein
MKQNIKQDARARAQAARRAAQLRREAEERVAAVEQGQALHDAFAAETQALPSAAQSTPKRRKRAEGYSFTAADITALRDVQGLSWRQVATNLDLANPGQARKAYAELTGRDYRATVTTTRTASIGLHGTARKFFSPQWHDDSDQDEIIAKLERSVIVVKRAIVDAEEEIKVGRVQRLTWDGPAEELCVHFVDYDTGGARSILVKNIKEVK